MTGVRSPQSADVEVVLGVDTHLEFHVAVALDTLGRRLGELAVPTTTKGYKRLLCWAEDFGPVRCAGVEGTSSYGAGLARYLSAAGVAVAEVERPKRRHLRRNGKSDPLDAEAAARTVLAGETAGTPKSADARVEMIRALKTARRSAVKARGQAANQLQALVVTAPDAPCAIACAGSRPGGSSRQRAAFVQALSPRPRRRQLSSRSVRWPAVTRPSRRR